MQDKRQVLAEERKQVGQERGGRQMRTGHSRRLVNDEKRKGKKVFNWLGKKH